MGLLAELRRRNVIRMAGLYLVAAWLITQVAGTVLPMFGAPEWMPRSVVILLAIGFIPALIFAWVFEMTPEGLKLDADVAPGQSIAPQTAQRMNRMIIAVLLLALSYLGFDKFVLAPKREAAAATSLASAAPAGKPANAPPAISDKSIAVLPFSDLSPEHDQDYFSDGMAEEILNALAQVKDMKVAGRTSSFYYKGRNEDLRVIGKALAVANVLEGSVRKQGDKVRITAQLIRTSDGYHLYSESFDGDLKDVFALQEKIARAITEKLQVVLSDQQSTRLVNTGTRNSEAYGLYLQATSIFNRRDGAQMPDAIAALQEAVRLDPNYARAYARLASLHLVLVSYTGADIDTSYALLDKYAKQATALDPRLAEPYAARGLADENRRNGLVSQRQLMEKALSLEPDDVTTNFWFGLSLLKCGYFDRGRSLIDHALQVDPLVPNALRWRGVLYLFQGESAKAEELLTRSRDLGQASANRELADLAMARGDTALARSLWIAGGRSLLSGMPQDSADIFANAMYGGDAAARQRAVDQIDRFLTTHPHQVPGVVPLVLVRIAEPAKALAIVRDHKMSDSTDYFSLLWSPLGDATRRLPEFQQTMRQMGYVAVWNQYGAPDRCRKLGPDNYACD